MRISSFYTLLALAGCFVSSAEVSAQVKLPTIELTAGIHVIHAEVAATEATRQKGLMFRQALDANEGMLFVFDAPANVCMWMKNTPLALSVAFIDQAGKIINIEDMQPYTTDSHCAKSLAQYALEVKQGWFEQKHIQPGNAIDGLPKRQEK